MLADKLGIPAPAIARFVGLLKAEGRIVEPGEYPAVSIKDAAGLPIRARAVAAQADVFVAGDRELLDLRRVGDLPVVPPRELWLQLFAHSEVFLGPQSQNEESVMNVISRCRRKLPLLLVALGLAVPMAPAQTADNYPTRAVRLITPANPGGTTDFLARLLALHLTKAWGQQAIVDNRGSASGVNGAEITKNAAPDGHTLFMAYHQHTVNAALIAKLPYHPVNDFTPITQMTEGGLLLVVNPSHPAKNAREFVQWVKTTKDPINIGSAGIGSGGHLAGELLKLMAGFEAQHIPYKGTGPAIIGLLAGEYHFNFMGLTGAFGQVRAGKLRAIAVSTTKRLPTAPDIPALSEVLPGFEVVGWYGVAGPAKMPKALVAKIHDEIVRLVKSPEFIKTMRNNGSEAVSSTPEEFRQFMLNDMKKWADVVKRAGIKAR